MGWPLTSREYGGGWIYGGKDNIVSLGFVTGLDYPDPRLDPQDLASFLTGQYADAGWSRTDHYAWISGLLLELGITSLDELSGLLTSVDTAAINARLAYKYPPGAVRRLDDALLAVFGNRYLDLHGNAHRRDLLATRLEKLRAEHADDG